jgi:hypothetical protein
VTGISRRSKQEVPLNRGAKCTRAYDSKVSAPSARDVDELPDGRPKMRDPPVVLRLIVLENVGLSEEESPSRLQKEPWHKRAVAYDCLKVYASLWKN